MIEVLRTYSDGAYLAVVGEEERTRVIADPDGTIWWADDWLVVWRLVWAGVLGCRHYGPASYGDAAAIVPMRGGVS